MGKFDAYKTGDTINLSGDIFRDDRARGTLKSKIQFIDADKIAIELNRGWFAKDNSIGVTNADKFDANKKYYWVYDPQQISKAEDAPQEPAVQTKPQQATQGVAAKTQTKVEESSKTANNTTTNISKKENNMSIVDQFKTDSVSAAYRVGGRKLTAVAQKGLLAVMKSQGMKRKELNAMVTVAETEFGRAAIGQILGQALIRVPGLKEDKRVQRLAEELRVESIANGMEFTLDSLVGNFLPQFLPGVSEILEALPDPTATAVSTKLRVAPHTDEKVAVAVEAEHEAEHEAAHHEKKRAKA